MAGDYPIVGVVTQDWYMEGADLQLLEFATCHYALTNIVDRYYCSFGVNRDFRPRLGDLRVTGWDDLDEARVVELPNHPYFIATLFVPGSTPSAPHPLAVSFLNAARLAATEATAHAQPKQASVTSSN